MIHPGQLTVRPATLDDLEVLTDFSAAMAFETEQRSLDRIRLRGGTLAVLERSERGQFYVADVQEAHGSLAVGQCLITYEWSDWRNAQFWWIQSVYVRPDWRRRGVYRRMHERIHELARSRPDVCGLRLYVERDNRVAQSAYQSLKMVQAPYEIWEVDFVL
ncbi:MAG TPA: GNAT family N-acetyltransferase [Nitrospiraceae bacterium]|jgi:GNAT superfamily N-acetyltransferase|nr:GNAT family N-acetyltransferase [Nitrospiraceae bacterium]